MGFQINEYKQKPYSCDSCKFFEIQDFGIHLKEYITNMSRTDLTTLPNIYSSFIDIKNNCLYINFPLSST